MILDILTPPQGPRGQDKKAVARPIYVSNSHTNLVDLVQEFRRRYRNGQTGGIKFSTPKYPQVPPRRQNENPVGYIFVSIICESTH